MKKFAHLFLCLTLIIISGFAIMGCSNNQSEEVEDSPENLVFNECFGFSEITTYTGGLNITSIDELSQLGNYKSVSLYTKKTFSFNHFSFKISSDTNSLEEVYITIKFGTNNNWNSISNYIIKSDKTNIDCYYVLGSNSGSKYFNDNATNPNISLINYEIQKNTVITIFFGTQEGYQNYPAEGQYDSLIKLTDFSIE